MSPEVIGQRCVSEREPELGLGRVVGVADGRITVEFPAPGEKRLYALGTPVLQRVQFHAGDALAARDGTTLVVESVEEAGGVLTYGGQGRRLREDEISDITNVGRPPERLLSGQADPNEVFELRLRALQAQARFRQSPVRGFLGGRVELIPHQFYILNEVSSRQDPRVLLADEVGLGKTIEACLILQRLLAVGKVRRALVLVPEPLTHQWFVELLRRFNLWFAIYDEDRCLACEQSDPDKNPFAAAQLVLAAVGFLAGRPGRRDQAAQAGWDLVIVDEAHHLEWTPEAASPEYLAVETVARRSPGLLLLTATPTQLGLAGHFARLRLLDPHRYADFAEFQRETEGFGVLAGVVERIVGQKPLTARDRAGLTTIFRRDPERLDEHLTALGQGRPGAREALLQTLLDQHGTGRVVFRNTRAAMSGFPPRKLQLAPLPENNLAQLARSARELRAEETGATAEIRYSFKEDARIEWLAALLKHHRPDKVLLICKSARKAMAIEAALREKMTVKTGLFHEGLPLVQRDRQAAWFAEPDGAQLLICSELGSEGRNFQFAHRLVFFDLPLNPGLLEQRIGRLDRIGQTQPVRIHLPYLEGSSEECLAKWYHLGLDAFESPLPGGNEYQDAFHDRLFALALAYGENGGQDAADQAALDALIRETVAFRHALAQRLKEGRDRLLELNSFHRDTAEAVIGRIQAADADPFLRGFLSDLLDHFGVRIKEHEEGDVFLDPSHAYVEGFPSLPPEGMLATFDRRRAIAREDIRFVSADHALVQDAIDLLVDSPAGTTAFGLIEADEPNLLLEAVFVLEAVADSRWHVEQFLAPTPVRVMVDLRRRDQTDARPPADLQAERQDGSLRQFLERPGFNAEVLKLLVDEATERARERSRSLVAEARVRADTALTAGLQRLTDLRRVNDHIRAEEIELAREQLGQTRSAIAQARLRLDSIRLLWEGPNNARRPA